MAGLRVDGDLASFNVAAAPPWHPGTERDSTPLWRRKRTHMAIALFFMELVCYADRGVMSVVIVVMSKELAWAESTAGLVLSAFFWGYLCLQVFAGWAVSRWGARPVLALSMGIWSACSLATPALARRSLPALLAVRFVIGLGEGLTMPAAHHLAAVWAPAAERSRFIAFCSSGQYVGAVVGMASSMLAAYDWPSVFYLCSAVGCLWTVAWLCCVSSTPQSSSSISGAELRYLRATVGEVKRVPIPWRLVLTNAPFRAVVAAHFASNWCWYLLLSWLPTFLSEVAHVDTQGSGLMLVAPYVPMFALSNAAGHLTDALLQRGWRLVVARKLMNATSGAGLVLAFSLFGVIGAAATPASAALCSLIGLSSVSIASAGYWANVADLSKDLCGVLLGVTNTIATLPGVLANVSTGYILQHTSGGWSTVFMLAIAMQCCGQFIYLRGASSDVQF